MKFKVGDMVRFKSWDYTPQLTMFTNAEYCAERGYSLFRTYEVYGVGSETIICKGIGIQMATRFELVNTREPEVCDYDKISFCNQNDCIPISK